MAKAKFTCCGRAGGEFKGIRNHLDGKITALFFSGQYLGGISGGILRILEGFAGKSGVRAVRSFTSRRETPFAFEDQFTGIHPSVTSKCSKGYDIVGAGGGDDRSQGVDSPVPGHRVRGGRKWPEIVYFIEFLARTEIPTGNIRGLRKTSVISYGS